MCIQLSRGEVSLKQMMTFRRIWFRAWIIWRSAGVGVVSS